MKTRIIVAAAFAVLAVASLAGCSAAAGTKAGNENNAKAYVMDSIAGSNTSSLWVKGMSDAFTSNQLKQYGAGCSPSGVTALSNTEIVVHLKCAGTTADYNVDFNKVGKIDGVAP
jgi:hypothetical protein